ncbi:hypothetical protein [Niallia sp. BSM11]|uniref:hypothetical protein n=1 Tax=Niallia sp. BSM11 TaxID=3391576 RepID=UPI0039849289
MNRLEKHANQDHKKGEKKLYLISCGVLLLLFIGGFIFTELFFADKPNDQNLGDKVIITLPTGKKVFTYENLIVEENGKLLYKGERNTIDLTGGVVVYEDWD